MNPASAQYHQPCGHRHACPRCGGLKFRRRGIAAHGPHDEPLTCELCGATSGSECPVCQKEKT